MGDNDRVRQGRRGRSGPGAAVARRLFTPPTTTREQALTRMERTSAVTHLVASLEHLARPSERGYGGMNNWEISRDASPVRNRAARRALETIGRRDVTTGLHCARVASALTLLSPWGGRGVRLGADLSLAAISYALHPRHHYGTDGSDQVSFLVQGLAALGRAAGHRTQLADAALWAAGLQATMSYAVSGWAKLAGPSWRNGTALQGVMRTRTYGDRRMWELARRFPRTSRVMGAGVLALECGFPLVYVGRGRLAVPFLAGTTMMHLSIARVMALGRFLSSFTAMHPAVLYTTRERSTTGAGGAVVRSDTVAHLTAIAVAGLAVAAAHSRRTTARVSRGGRGDERYLRTADGNTLAYRRWGTEDPSTPLYVFEAGLLSTSEHWDWMADELSAHGTVLTYQRAGYGASTLEPGTALLLDDLVDHAVELVEGLAGEREVVLVGHSLGGYLAVRAAARVPERLRTVVLVDSSHPDELRRSPGQAKGSEGLTTAFPMMAASLELGLGALLEIPEWVNALPEPARATALAQYRDPRHWHTGRREWAATLRDFESEPGLPELEVPVLSLSAQVTLDQDPEQKDMHQEMAELGPDGAHEIVHGADHDSIVSHETHARSAGRMIRDFVASRAGVRRSVRGVA